jgi:hypothetical protein
MVVAIVNPTDFLQLGLEIVGYSLSRQTIRHKTNVERFMAHFGTSPESCSAIFVDLQTTQIAMARIAKPDILCFFMTLRPLPARTSKGYPRWDGSDAERLLKEDADEGLTNSIKPSDLHETRPEYQAFPLKTFRDHIHQENRSRTGKAYWMNRQQKAKK